MSKHSKWAKVKNQKLAADVKKGAVFTKHSRSVSVAARQGADPEKNFKLRMAIEAAKAASVPKDTIDRAVKRGAGKLNDEELFEVTYEGLGPGKVGLMIEAVTNNKNRTVNSIRKILENHGGVLAQSGSVSWQFKRQGVARLNVPRADELELALIDLGAEDIKEEDGGLTVYAAVNNFQNVLQGLSKMGITPEYQGLEWVPKEVTAVDELTHQKLEKLYEDLENDDDAQNYFTSEA